LSSKFVSFSFCFGFHVYQGFIKESFELTESFLAELQILDFADCGRKADDGRNLVSTFYLELVGFYSEL